MLRPYQKLAINQLYDWFRANKGNRINNMEQLWKQLPLPYALPQT